MQPKLVTASEKYKGKRQFLFFFFSRCQKDMNVSMKLTKRTYGAGQGKVIDMNIELRQCWLRIG